MSSGSTQKFSLFALTTMAVGGMIGAGIFLLPRSFARLIKIGAKVLRHAYYAVLQMAEVARERHHAS